MARRTGSQDTIIELTSVINTALPIPTISLNGYEQIAMQMQGSIAGGTLLGICTWTFTLANGRQVQFQTPAARDYQLTLVLTEGMRILFGGFGWDPEADVLGTIDEMPLAFSGQIPAGGVGIQTAFRAWGILK